MTKKDIEGPTMSIHEEGIIVGGNEEEDHVNVRLCTLIKGAASDDPRILEPTQMETSEGGKLKRNSFACISCHSLKQKCVPSDISDIYRKPCIRCLKNTKLCKFDLSKRTRKRKRRDSPVSSPSSTSPRLEYREGRRENPTPGTTMAMSNNNTIGIQRRPYSHDILQGDQQSISDMWSNQSHSPAPISTPTNFNHISTSGIAAAGGFQHGLVGGLSTSYPAGYPTGYATGYTPGRYGGYPDAYSNSGYAGGIPIMLNTSGTPPVSISNVLLSGQQIGGLPENIPSSIQDPTRSTHNSANATASTINNMLTTNNSTTTSNNAPNNVLGVGGVDNINASLSGSVSNLNSLSERNRIIRGENVPSHKKYHYIFKGQLQDLLTYQKGKLGQISSTLSSLIKEWDTFLQSSMSIGSASDPMSLGIILQDEADLRLRIFLNDVVPKVNLPFVDISKGTNAEQLRRNKPILFSTVMSCVSGMMTEENTSQETNMKLDSFLLDLITDQIFRANNKSMELIESLLTLCFWYNFPEWAHKARYHIFNYVCVCLTKEMSSAFLNRAFGVFLEEDPNSSQRSLSTPLEQYENGARLVLLVYISSLNISIFLRQSIKVRWSAITEKACSKIREMMSGENKESYFDDKTLVIFARLNRVLEKIHINLHERGALDLDYGEDYEFTRKHIDHLISRFKYDLSEIYKEIPKDRHRVLAYFYSVEAYLYQYIIGSYIESMPSKFGIGPLPGDISDAFLRCYDFCALTLKEFIKLTPSLVSSLPLFHSSRIIYTVGMLLLKLRFSTIALPVFQQFQHSTEDAIFLVTEVTKLLEKSSTIFKFNNFLYKLRYVVALFVQIYGNKVKAFINANNKKMSAASTTTTTAEKTSGVENCRPLTTIPTIVPTGPNASTNTNTNTNTTTEMIEQGDKPDPNSVILNNACPTANNTVMMIPNQASDPRDFENNIGFPRASYDRVTSSPPDVQPSSAPSTGNINNYLTDIDSIVLGFNALNDEFWTDIFSNDL